MAAFLTVLEAVCCFLSCTSILLEWGTMLLEYFPPQMRAHVVVSRMRPGLSVSILRQFDALFLPLFKATSAALGLR